MSSEMNGVIKAGLIIFTLLYVLSPIDFMPGPIDDLLVIILQVVLQNKLQDKNAVDV